MTTPLNKISIYLVRHGETLWNKERRYQGQMDSPLTHKGIEQATLAGCLIASLGIVPTSIYSSPLGRALSTAALVCDAITVDRNAVIQSDLIKECHFGNWQGLTREEVESQFPGEIIKRNDDKWNYVPEGGESYSALMKRAETWIKSLAPQQSIIVVAHEMINRVIRGIMLNLKPKDILNWKQPNGSVVKISPPQGSHLKVPTSRFHLVSAKMTTQDATTHFCL